MGNVITIDGPSGVGKSAIGPALAAREGYRFLGIGSLYRSLTWEEMSGREIGPGSSSDVRLVELRRGASPAVEIDGRIVDPDHLYGDPQLEARSASVALRPHVRALVAKLVREYVARGDIVVEGRSAHRIIPDAALKVYLWADEKERARRAELEHVRSGHGARSSDAAELTDARDRLDRTRAADPLRLCADMVAWDSSHASLEETVSGLQRYADHYMGRRTLRLSIVIPVRDRERHLELCLRRLQAQSVPREQYQIIVVDDGSSDNSGPRARQLGADMVLRNSPRGPGQARNLGLAHVDGDVVAFLDADMLVRPDFVAEHLRLHARANGLVVLGARRHLPPDCEDPDADGVRRDSREVICDRHSYNLAVLRLPWSLAYTCNLSVDSRLLRDLRFDESFTGWGLEDVELAYRLNQRGARWAFSRRVAALHLYHDRSPSPERFRAWLANMDRFRERHPAAEIQQLSELRSVFDPAVRADYLDAFETLNGTQPPKADGLIVDGVDAGPGGLELLQDVVYAPENERSEVTFVADDVVEYEVLLAAALPGRAVRWYTPADWQRVEAESCGRYSSAGRRIRHTFLRRSDPVRRRAEPALA